MSEPDLSQVLRDVLAGPDAVGLSQPSRLRVAMQRRLGPDMGAQRGRVHQLSVAAEERIPLRMQREGTSPQVLEELAESLVLSRGWTHDAAEWAVTTWARAVQPAGDPVPAPSTDAAPKVPDGAVDSAFRPGGGLGVPISGPGLPDGDDDPTDLPVSTDLPSSTDLPMVTDLPSSTGPPVGFEVPSGAPGMTGGPGADRRPDSVEVVISSAAPNSPPPPPSPGFAPVAASAVRVDVAGLPARQTKATTEKASRYLGHEVDIAYQVKGGNPGVAFLALPLAFGPLVPGGIVGALMLMLFCVAVAAVQLLVPTYLLVIDGPRVKVLQASRLGRPRELLCDVSPAEVALAGGAPFASVRVLGHRLWFALPHRAAAASIAGAGSVTP